MEDYLGNNDWIANGPSELAGGAATPRAPQTAQQARSAGLRGVFLLERAIPWTTDPPGTVEESFRATAGLAAFSAPRKLFPQSLSQSGCSEGHSAPDPL